MAGMNNLSSILKFIAEKLMTSKTANTVLAAPNGSDGLPSYRSLVAADIPSLDSSKVSTGNFASSRITGNFDSSRITGYFSADKINSGTFNADRIPSLNASKINTGTFTVGSFSADINTSGAVKSNNTKLITIHTASASSSTTVPANGTATFTMNVSRAGYTPVGVIGFDIKNEKLSVIQIGLSGSSVKVKVANNTSSLTSFAPDVTVLYVPSTQGI